MFPRFFTLVSNKSLILLKCILQFQQTILSYIVFRSANSPVVYICLFSVIGVCNVLLLAHFQRLGKKNLFKTENNPREVVCLLLQDSKVFKIILYIYLLSFQKVIKSEPTPMTMGGLWFRFLLFNSQTHTTSSLNITEPVNFVGLYRHSEM